MGGSGPTVVVATDPPNSLEHHAEQLARLSRHRRVLCLELPGFGGSTPPSGFDFSPASTAALLIALLEREGPAVLSFSCVAGLAAVEAAGRRPDLVRGMVLAQVPSLSAARAWAKRLDTQGLLRTPFLGQTLVRAARAPLARSWYRAALPKGADAEPWIARTLEAYREGADYCLASALQSLGEATPLAPTSVPAVLLWGQADRTHRSTDPEALRESLPQLRVERLEGIGHFPDLEALDQFERALDSICG